MTGISSLQPSVIRHSWIKSILPILPRFLKDLIVPFIIIGSMPQAKIGYFREKKLAISSNSDLPTMGALRVRSLTHHPWNQNHKTLAPLAPAGLRLVTKMIK